MVHPIVTNMKKKILIKPDSSTTTSTNGFLQIIPGTKINKIAVDFASEGLNNIAKKINEVIDCFNDQILEIDIKKVDKNH